MKSIPRIIMCFLIVSLISRGAEETKGHLIPKDSKVEHDFRVSPNPFMMDSVTAEQLKSCETYEELRDQLKIIIPKLLKVRY